MFFEASRDLRVHIPDPGQQFENVVGPQCRVVTLSTFLDHILPPLPHNVNVSQVVNTLHRTGKRQYPNKPITLQGCWRGFNTAPCRNAHPAETAFNGLQSAVDSVITASGWAGDDRQLRLHYETNANPVAEPGERDANTLPDAGLFYGPDPSWRSIVVCGEHAKFDHPILANMVRDFI